MKRKLKYGEDPFENRKKKQIKGDPNIVIDNGSIDY